MKPKYAVRLTARGGDGVVNNSVVAEVFTALAPALRRYVELEQQYIDPAGFSFEAYMLALVHLRNEDDHPSIVGYLLRGVRYWRGSGRWEFYTGEDNSRGEGTDDSDEVAWVATRATPVFFRKAQEEVGVVALADEVAPLEDGGSWHHPFNNLVAWSTGNEYIINSTIGGAQ